MKNLTSDTLKYIGLCWFCYLLAACGGGSGGGKDSMNEVNISGRLFSNDGETPIVNGTLYVEGTGRQQVGAISCEIPDTEYQAMTCTDNQGEFSFDVNVPQSVNRVSAFKGAFKATATIDPTQRSVKLASLELNESRVAVITGSYDEIETILAKSGYGQLDENGELVLGTETFDLYDGDSSLPEAYPELFQIFEMTETGQAKIFDYDLVFINCGADEGELRFQNLQLEGVDLGGELTSGEFADVADIIREYVEAGGRIYTTDLAYDYIEQAFPEFIDFEGSEAVPAVEPEFLNVAERGVSDIIVDGQIFDSALIAFLSNVTCGEGESCIDQNDRVRVDSFAGGWGVINGAHTPVLGNSEVKFWVEGDVEFSENFGEITTEYRPLTASFAFGKGKVIYSSYHSVHAGSNTSGSINTSLAPQERILQFLVFE